MEVGPALSLLSSRCYARLLLLIRSSTLSVSSIPRFYQCKDYTMADQEAPELVDPAVVIKEKCSQTKECAALLEKFNACNDRVASKSTTTETCEEEQTDFLHCIDHCLAPELFKHLK